MSTTEALVRSLPGVTEAGILTNLQGSSLTVKSLLSPHTGVLGAVVLTDSTSRASSGEG